MPVNLSLAKSPKDIQKSLASFVSGAATHSELTRSLIASTSF